MFGHLDDHSPPTPDAATLGAVRRRARRHQQRRAASAIGAACVVLLVGFVVVVNAPFSSRPLSSAQTAFQFNARKGPLKIGAPVPTTALANVIFVNANQGFSIALHRGDAVLAATSDGGNSWEVVDAHLPEGFAQGEGFPGSFEFTDPSHGFLWGGAPSAQGDAPLWVTSNGGASWHEASIGPIVYDFSAIGSNLWAVVGSCAPLSGSSAEVCTSNVATSYDDGASWSEPGTEMVQGGTTGTPSTHELARITRSHAYLLSVANISSGTSMVLYYTDDGGTQWSTRPAPCAGAFDLGAELAASSSTDLWLLCGSQGSGGSQSKQLFRSSDGGDNWTLTAKATGLGTPAKATGPNPLPLAGYIAPFSVGHTNLAVASPSTAWLYPGGGVVYETTSGGMFWTPVSTLQSAELGTGAPGNITFISDTQGWVCELGVGLWHTGDGVHWSPLGQ